MSAERVAAVLAEIERRITAADTESARVQSKSREHHRWALAVLRQHKAVLERHAVSTIWNGNRWCDACQQALYSEPVCADVRGVLDCYPDVTP